MFWTKKSQRKALIGVWDHYQDLITLQSIEGTNFRQSSTSGICLQHHTNIKQNNCSKTIISIISEMLIGVS